MSRAVVTGSDSGIGRAAAVALALRGHDVGVTWNGESFVVDRGMMLVSAMANQLTQ